MKINFPTLETKTVSKNPNESRCEGCYFDGVCNVDLIEKITGVDCHIGVIFIESNEKHTKDNIGDDVKMSLKLDRTLVEDLLHIFKGKYYVS